MRRRSTAVFVEAVLGVAAVGILVGTPVGYAVAGAAAVTGIAGLVRRRGRGLPEVAADRLRDPVAAVPEVQVVDVETRDGALGVAGDGQGFAVVLDAGTPPPWPLADVVDLLADPARPAAVQVVVEQRGPAGVDPRFGPTRTYRSLPAPPSPLWSRVLLVIRHEPAWAPETVESRGGGATGARNALAAVAARAVARAEQQAGVRLRTTGADELVGLLRDLGPAPELDPGSDVVLGVPLSSDDAVGAVLRALAGTEVTRTVLSVSASALDHTVRALVRITDARPEVVGRAADGLITEGLATTLPDDPHDGVLATLPLGVSGSLGHVIAQERR